MKKAISLVLVVVLLLAANALPCYAQRHGHGGGHSGGHVYRGGHGYGGGHVYGGGHRHGYSSFRGSIWIGPGWGGWGGWDPWWWGSPAYPYYYPYYNSFYYPYYSPYYRPYYYSEPPVITEQQPPAYAQPAPEPEEQYYWYFCPDAKNYYPYVKHCPKGWLKVVPRETPPDVKE
jgi:hypothetical protein